MHGIYLSESDIDLLMYRFDKNYDGRITMEEVINYFIKNKI